jgi:hypothetical protein
VPSDPVDSSDSSGEELLKHTESILERRRVVLRHSDRAAIAPPPEKPPEVARDEPEIVNAAPQIVSDDEEIVSGGENTSDDLELLNPMIIPRDLDKNLISFRISDSDSESVEESLQISVSREDMSAAPGEEEAEPIVNEPIFRLAKEMRQAAVELKREREQRRKLSFGIAGKRPGYFNDLSDSDDEHGDHPTGDDESDG